MSLEQFPQGFRACVTLLFYAYVCMVAYVHMVALCISDAFCCSQRCTDQCIFDAMLLFCSERLMLTLCLLTLIAFKLLSKSLS